MRNKVFNRFKYLVVRLLDFFLKFKAIFFSHYQILKRVDCKFLEFNNFLFFFKYVSKSNSIEKLLHDYRLKPNIYLKICQNDINNLQNNNHEIFKIIQNANDILNKNFMFQYDWDMEKTSIPYQFLNEIDWKAKANGDEEWCFMLNRHRFWVDLGKAYFITGEERYAVALINQLEHWIDNNPINFGLKKYSWRRLEAGIRCENWIKSYEYIKESKYITSKFHAKFLNSLYQHGVYLNSCFNDFSKKSNWGVIEFHGLFNLSVFLNDFTIASTWLNNAIERLTVCAKTQILDDGTQWEQSPMYHNEVFHCFLNVILIAQRRGIVLPEIILEKTKEMAYANVQWSKPNFHQPLLGDSDDTDLRGLLTLAASLFDDPIIKSRAFDEIDFETQFIVTKKQIKNYNKIRAINPNFLSVFQQNSGDLYMRSSWGEDSFFSSLHLKKIQSGHSHDNVLHFSLFANNKDYLIDGGRYTYINNKWREFFKSSKSHNSLGVDDLSNSLYGDSWANEYDASSKGVYTKLAPDFDYAEAENLSYLRLADPVSLKRRMLFLKPNIWLLIDSFSSNDHHKYSQYFNFSDENVEICNAGLTTTFTIDNLRIQPLNKVKIKLENSWRSPEYNLKIRNKRAEFYWESNGFTSFITLLYFPELVKLKFKKIPVYNINNNLLLDSEAEAIKIFIENMSYVLFIQHNSATSNSKKVYKVDNRLLTGEVVFFVNDENSTIEHIIKG